MPLRNVEAIPRKERISVTFLIDQLKNNLDLDLNPCFSEVSTDDRWITDTDLHRPGLALAGYVELFTHHRIQVIGNSESQYISHLGYEACKESFQKLTQFPIPVIFLTDNNVMPDSFLEMSKKAGIPVFQTPMETTEFMFLVRDFLEDQFAVQTMVHGSVVDVYGVGILILGKSGIGKSEVALDLVERGHRLVSDDVIILTKKNNVLIASPTDINKHFMEIRGLGIIDVMSMFGIRSIRYQKRVEVILNLSLWDDTQHIDRTGLNKASEKVLGLNIPLINLPITPGKNITVIAEVIAMNHLLNNYGYDSAKTFQKKIQQRISEKKAGSPVIQRAVNYFEGDLE
ncbi:HPr(Ser) kinase/phosphatase [Balneolaceae bacterium ANBcel3]|nr:HPr(Ser) kinase/phosphatase [Balneolaceae bacterium ANBcel3]